MPRGQNLKGKPKVGGRKAGTPNRATVEVAERARLDVERAQGAGKKLGKEVLEDFMHLFAGMAAAYQPLPPGIATPAGRQPDEAKFVTYATLAVKTAKDLADFQSPKFRAIMVTAPDAPAVRPPTLDNSGNVVQLNDAVAMARVYQNIVRRVG